MKRLIKFLIILIIFLLLYFILFKILEVDKTVMKKIYPLKYSEYVEKYAKEYDIDKYLVYAIIKAESNFKEDAKSASNAVGLMQIMEATAFETANKMDLDVSEEDLFNPELNIKIGLKYFASLLEKYNNNYNLAVIAYNAGIGNVDKWIKDGIIKEDGTDIENVPFKETNNYIRKILRDYEIYKELYRRQLNYYKYYRGVLHTLANMIYNYRKIRSDIHVNFSNRWSRIYRKPYSCRIVR